MGSVRAAYDSSSMLPTMPAPVRTLGTSRVKPSVYFIPTAQPTSSRPATTSRTQAMTGTSGTRTETGVRRLCLHPGTARLVGAPRAGHGSAVGSVRDLHPSPGNGKGLVTMVTSPLPPQIYRYKP